MPKIRKSSDLYYPACDQFSLELIVAFDKFNSTLIPSPMREKISLFSLMIVLACASPKKEESSTDSTQVDTTTTAVPVQTSQNYTPSYSTKEYRSNFPGYLTDTFTEDSTELLISTALFELMNRYDTAELLTITRDFTYTFDTPNEYDEGTTLVTKTDNSTWYFDADNGMSLRAYSHTWGESESYTGTTICIFENGEMVSVYHDKDITGQDTQLSRDRAVFSACPTCGYNAVNPNMGYGENSITLLDESYKSRLVRNFEALFADLQSTLAINTDKGGYVNEMYVFTVVKQSEQGAEYTEEYRVNEKLVPRFMTNGE